MKALEGLAQAVEDGIFLKIAILCAVGITESREKEFLGFLPGGRESRLRWTPKFRQQVKLGL